MSSATCLRMGDAPAVEGTDAGVGVGGNMTQHKPILIVDDDAAILQMLAESLKSLGVEYPIVTAMSSTEALEKIERQTFAVVIADYMMPGITGIDLARAVRKISPDTQVVLMTAYGTARLRDTTRYVGVDGYLDKPFTVDELHAIIQNAVRMPPPAKNSSENGEPANLDEAIHRNLEGLLVNTNARSVLLLKSGGNLVQVVGQGGHVEVTGIGAFVAANFQAAKKLAHTLGSRSVFKSSYFEGDDYNLYTLDITDRFLLAVIFEKERRPGVVWFYTKQAAATLRQLFDRFGVEAVE